MELNVNDLQEFVIEIAKNYKTRIAYRYLEYGNVVEKTYAEFTADVFAVASWLHNHEHRDEKIAIIGGTSYYWVVTFVAAAISSNTVIPIDKMLPKEEIFNLIERGDASLIFMDEEFWGWSKEISEQSEKKRETFSFSDAKFKEMLKTARVRLPKVKPETPCLLLFTSGTTGVSKGVLISHKNITSNINEITRMEYTKDIPSNVEAGVLSVLPIYHTFELTVGHLGILGTGSIVNINDKLENITENMKRFRPAVMLIVPAIAEVLSKKIMAEFNSHKNKRKVAIGKKADKALSNIGINAKRTIYKAVYKNFGGNLTTFVVGGSALRPDVEVSLEEIGLHLYQGYGMTECAPLIAANFPGNNRVGSVGKPVSYMDVIVRDGEIMVKGDGLMLSYYGDLGEVNKDEVYSDGYFKTGDLGYFDKDGYLYITGRSKNLIILANGKNVYPEEIEEYIIGIPGVKECMVYEDEGAIAALIVPESMNEKTDIRKIKEGINNLNNKIPAYKRVVRLSFRPSDLPKTTTMKIKRKEVMAWIEKKKEEQKVEYVAPETTEQIRLCEIMEQVLHSGRIGIKDNFFDRGGDSMAALEFATLVGIQAQDVYDCPTVEELESMILNGQKETVSSEKIDVNAILRKNNNLIVKGDPNYILLTGATGFLGAHILRELCLRKQNVVCLVRNAEKLKPTLKAYFPKEYEKFNYKVVTGDIELEHFGLNEKEYKILSRKIDMVFHVAANVRHTGNYADFERSNVMGTQHVIDFCKDADAILQHTSTASVNGAGTVAQRNKNAKFDEFCLDIGQHYEQNVYIHSKYQSEVRVLMAREEGLKANIFRIGNLTWRKSDGKFQKNAGDNGFLARLKGLLKVGMYTQEIAEYPIDFTAVDECAEAYVLLALNHHVNNVYNLYNPNVYSLDGLCRKAMVHAKRVPKEVFEKTLKSMIQDKEVTVLSFYNAIASSSANIKTSNTFTTAELKKLGFTWSKIGISYLKYVKHLL